MVVRPQKSFPSASLALSLFCFFCCTFVVLLPVLARASAPSLALAGFCQQPELEKAIFNYGQFALHGGWPRIPAGPALRQNDSNERILLLKQRLAVSGDLAAPPDQTDHFDESVKAAVQRFQARHGLVADGIAGRKTLTELNVPVSERIRQLTANFECCQSLPPSLEHRSIVVNIADFTLKLFEEGKLLLAMPVIVGRSTRQTPVVHGSIASLVLNPGWEVPHIIASEDLLPKIKEDPGYLAQSHFRVFLGWKAEDEVNPATINWQGLSPAYFPYRLRQEPGPDNALGRVKFSFANPFSIYLHDTPAQELFRKDPRALSSGCIRLAKPLDLALYLLKGTSLDSLEALTAAISAAKTQTVRIPSPIAIHIIYMTAWVDERRIVQFRRDIYKRNPAL